MSICLLQNAFFRLLAVSFFSFYLKCIVKIKNMSIITNYIRYLFILLQIFKSKSTIDIHFSALDYILACNQKEAVLDLLLFLHLFDYKISVFKNSNFLSIMQSSDNLHIGSSKHKIFMYQ